MTRARKASLVLALLFVSCIPRDLAPIHPCVTSTVSKRIAVTGTSSVALLFVVDNSGSMAAEQVALAAELPRLIEGLVTGDADRDPSTPSLPPVASLRVAVVSSDLGVGVTSHLEPIQTCSDASIPVARVALGDDGVFNRVPIGAASVGMPESCDGPDADSLPDTLDQGSLPSFLTFAADGEVPAAAFADRISCYALLGTSGCGFEQQLESMLKAVTPSASDVRFHVPTGISADEARGQGDRANAGWLRDEALLAVLMVTDEDDCSAEDPVVFDVSATSAYAEGPTKTSTLSRVNTRCIRFGDEVVPNNPNGNQDLSLNTLYSTSRYAEGLIALKGGDPNDVVFALITGVPVASVDAPEDGEGEDNLEAILAQHEMSIRFLEALGDPFNGVVPSCTVCAFGFPNCDRGYNDLDGDQHNADDCVDVAGGRAGLCDPGESLNCTAEINGVPGCQIEETEVVALRRAVPPRRLVRTAQALHEAGAHVIVQSICQPDFSDAMTAILERISSGLATACVPRALIRGGDDTVACKVLETLPVGTSCASVAGRELDHVGPEGREVCTVQQLAVTDAELTSTMPPSGAGWYYDDFTPQKEVCPARPTRQRISFTEVGTPGASSLLALECDQPVPGDLEGPDVGRECADSAACVMTEDEVAVFALHYNLPRTYDGVTGPLVCEPRTGTCQMRCNTDADCPGGYACDTRSLEASVCVNPTCR